MVNTGYLITTVRNWPYEATRLETNSTLDETTDTVTVTVHQDIDADDQSDNEQQVTLSGGEETHDLTGFEAVDDGSDYWIRVDMETDGGAPSVDYAIISPPSGLIAGTIEDSDGTPVPGAEIDAVDMESKDSYTGTADSDGRYEIAVPPGTYHVTAYYEHVDGGEYATDTRPFIEVR